MSGMYDRAAAIRDGMIGVARQLSDRECGALQSEMRQAQIHYVASIIGDLERSNKHLLEALIALVERMERTGRDTANTLDLALTKKARAAILAATGASS
jgi:hypothetical protein